MDRYNINDFQYKYKMKTRFIDMDAFQHINNAIYASYIETARVELFRNWGIVDSNAGKSIIMASLKIDYIKQLTHPSEIIIGQRISRIGKTSFDIESAIFDSCNDVVCFSIVVAVCFDFISQLPVDVYKSIVRDYEK